MPIRPRRLYFILSLLFLSASPLLRGGARAVAVLSTTELKRMSVEELLQQEVVSVSRRPEALRKAAGNIFYIQGDSVRAIGGISLPELLRQAPNLFVAQVSSYNWGINARGLMRSSGTSNKMLVLVDGRTAYSPLFSNVFWDSTDVFLPDLANIEVISGPSGSNWGSNAVNGVINITTKSARDTVGGLLEVTGGTNGVLLGMRQGLRFGQDGAVRFTFKHIGREATLSATGAEDDFDRWQATQAGFRADWGRPADGTVTVQGDWRTGRFDSGANLPPIHNDSGNLLAKWARDLTPDSQLWVRAYYDYVLRDTRSVFTERTQTADVEFQLSQHFANGHNLLWGANYRRIQDQAEDTVGFAILPAEKRLNLTSLFAQHDFPWAEDRFRLTTGLRLERNTYTGWEVQPTVRLACQQQDQTAWLSVSRAVRTPSRLEKELFAPATPPFFFGGGPDFRSETLLAYELGWRGQLARGLSLTAVAYYHDYDHLHTVEGTIPTVEANGAEGRIYGVETFVDYDVTPTWRLRAGGFVMQQETGLKPGSLDTGRGQAESSFPSHQWFLRSSFQLTPAADLWLSLRRIGSVPTNANAMETIPAYTELNANLRWKLRPRLELALTGRNLLDASHPEIGALSVRREIRRTLSLSLRWEY